MKTLKYWLNTCAFLQPAFTPPHFSPPLIFAAIQMLQSEVKTTWQLGLIIMLAGEQEAATSRAAGKAFRRQWVAWIEKLPWYWQRALSATVRSPAEPNNKTAFTLPCQNSHFTSLKLYLWPVPHPGKKQKRYISCWCCYANTPTQHSYRLTTLSDRCAAVIPLISLGLLAGNTAPTSRRMTFLTSSCRST